jgi:hypothetical protein
MGGKRREISLPNDVMQRDAALNPIVEQSISARDILADDGIRSRLPSSFTGFTGNHGMVRLWTNCPTSASHIQGVKVVVHIIS